MTSSEYIELGKQNILKAYNRNEVVFDHGEGVRLYDVNNKEYLDFGSGIGVYALGYSNERYNNALKSQIDKLLHTSNLFYTVPGVTAAAKLTKLTGLSKVFFTNSGAEAIEGAIKAARKYAFLKDNCTDHEIIAMNHSFHGRTFGALSVTGNPKYQESFKPMIGNIKFADFNDWDSVCANLSDKTCAIIMETVQGEGGIYPAQRDFIEKVRKLCDEKDILLILDEIQCGMGRSGKMFAYEHFGIKPDILTVAKAVGGGVPVGAFIVNDKVANASLVPGDHGTTYGGNPFVCAAINEVIDIFEDDKVLDNVNEVAPYLEKKLDEVVAEFDFIKGQRGLGLMRGLILDTDKVKPGEVVAKALDAGLVIFSAGYDVVRFLPPLVISKSDVDAMIKILVDTLSTF